MSSTSRPTSSPHAGQPGSPTACDAFVAAMDIVGRRWNGRVVQAMGAGCRGFSEIARYVEGLSDQVLARRLRELESAGLITRAVLDGRPPAVRYALTAQGRALLPILDALTEWGHQLLDQKDRSPSAAPAPLAHTPARRTEQHR
ncbi:winged helix-turn-helix transcriptional regulator [Schaalia naturae]|uniref:Winged helix-turn-helix transcriptional regulator n=1 Tax=Schaalia naturae TaxID=635203 RepID=A0ABW2SIK7_9ACTO